MKLIYRELYTLNKNKPVCIPSVALVYSKDDNTLPMLEKENIFDDEYNTSYLSFSDVFKIFSSPALKKLQSIFDFGTCLLSNSDYINKDIWKQFLFTSNVNLAPIKKSIKSYNIFRKKSENDRTKSNYQIKVNRYYSNLKLNYSSKIKDMQLSLRNEIEEKLLNGKSIDLLLKHKYKINILKDEYSNAFLDITSTGRNNGEMVIEYEIESFNELELLYTFLDCIFSSEYNYSIKKCDKCKFFYIISKTDNNYCFKCKTIINNNRSKAFRDKEIYILENRLNSLYYNKKYKNNEEKLKVLEQYKKLKKKARKKFKADEIGMKNWFISQHEEKKVHKKKTTL